MTTLVFDPQLDPPSWRPVSNSDFPCYDIMILVDGLIDSPPYGKGYATGNLSEAIAQCIELRAKYPEQSYVVTDRINYSAIVWPT